MRPACPLSCQLLRAKPNMWKCYNVSLSSNYACVERPVDKFNYHQINTNYTLLGFPLPTLILQESEAEHEIPAKSQSSLRARYSRIRNRKEEPDLTRTYLPAHCNSYVHVKRVSPWEEATIGSHSL